MGKMLRVDMTTGSLTDENLPEEPVLGNSSAGRRWRLYMLMHEQPLDVKPYDPAAKMVMFTGPLTGTGFTPGGTKVCAVFLSPMTNYSLGRGAASGYWAAYLKQSGYDGIILEGAAKKPAVSFHQRRQAGVARREQVLGQGVARHRRIAARRCRHQGRAGSWASARPASI